MKSLLAITPLLLCSCWLQSTKEGKKTTPPPTITKVEVIDTCAMEKQLTSMGLVNVQDINPTIQVELRYADTNNFLHITLYDCLEKAFLQKEAALKLNSAQSILTALKPGYKLYIWDAVRPKVIQQRMWDSLKMPLDQKNRYVSNPKNHSVHNYGAAVDLTIQDSVGSLLDMGTDFDHFGPASNTNRDSFNLANKNLNHTQLANRRLLRKCMYRAGFRAISSEWWHFNSCSRETAKKRYQLLE
jgi:D-alanyl-D-alanine dipeptidase